jgi:hypothetical protein
MEVMVQDLPFYKLVINLLLCIYLKAFNSLKAKFIFILSSLLVIS